MILFLDKKAPRVDVLERLSSAILSVASSRLLTCLILLIRHRSHHDTTSHMMKNIFARGLFGRSVVVPAVFNQVQ